MSPLVIVVFVLAQLGVGPASATEVDPARLEQMARRVLSRLEKMRGQKLSKPLKTGVKDKAQVTKFVRERLAEEYGPAKVAAEGRMLELFGLLPAGMDYGAFLTSLLTEQVAGFYDHTRQELHIASWLPPILQEPVMAHEIFHAIQDQEWGGGKLIDSKKYTHDEVLAHAALLEGDATVVMFNYQQSVAGADVDITRSPVMARMMAASLPLQMSSPQFPVMAAAPDYLKQSLIFPYQQGLLFIVTLRNAGMSWKDIRGVYADPPASTEQILHPEKYHPRRDHPSKVEIPPLLPEFERTWEGTAGEFHFRQLLLGHLPQLEAAEAAAGWDGDHTVLEVDGERAVVISAVTWDREEDGEAFLGAWRRAHDARKPPRPTLVASRRGTETFFALSHDADLARRAHEAVREKAHVTRR